MRDDDPREALAELRAQGARVDYCPDYLPPARAAELLAELLRVVVFEPPEQSRIRQPGTGRWIEIPRRQTAFGDPGTSYRFSGLVVPGRPFIPPVATLRDELRAATGFASNFVLVNHYRDGADHLGWHRDDERDLGDAPTILSLSLGGPRDFQLRIPDSGLPTVTLPLASGSLLLMHPPTNNVFQHRLPKRGGRHPERIPERVNLTWRFTSGAEAGVAAGR